MTLRHLAVLAALLAGTAAHADVPGDRTLTVMAGVAVPQHDDLEGFNTGFSTQLALGLRLSPNLAGEVGIGYSGTSTDTMSLVSNAGVPFTADASAYFVPVTGTVKLIAPLGTAEVYGLGGLGVYFAHLKGTANSSTASGTSSDSSASLGLHLGAGTAIRLSERASFTAELRYHLAKAEFFGADGHIDHLQLLGGVAFRL